MSANLPIASGTFGDEPTLTFPETAAPEGLQVAVLEAGDGPAVEAGQTIVVNYHGQIWNGGVFDSSFARGQTINFPIGVGMVIVGRVDHSRPHLIPPRHKQPRKIQGIEIHRVDG